MPGSVTPAFVSKLEARREEVRADAVRLLERAQRQGRRFLSPDEEAEYQAARASMRDLTERIDDTRAELRRCGSTPSFSRLSRALSGAGRVSPLAFEPDDLRGLHEKVSRGEPGRITARAFTGLQGQLPAQLFPNPLFPQHEDRVLDRLPGMLTDAPSVEYVRVTSVGGAPEIVPEGGLKPELTMPTDTVIAEVRKLAAHVGISWEATQDWDAFVQAVTTELTSRIVDLENAEIITGDGTTGHLDGLLADNGHLTHDASGVVGPDTALDHIEEATAELRTGPALATADLLILHPNAWSAIRRTKDGFDRYLTQPDPTAGEASSVWGVPVLTTISCPGDTGVLLDTTKFGRVLVREPLGVRVGFANDDFVRNIVRYVGEERLALAVERPEAVMEINGLPTAIVAQSGGKRRSAKKEE